MYEPRLLPSEEEYALLLRHFVGPNEQTARDAFDSLSNRIRGALERYVRKFGGTREDREDLVQTVLRRVWQSRPTFEPLGPGAWWRYILRTANRCAVDAARQRSASVIVEIREADDIPDEDLPYVDAMVIAINDTRAIYEAADRLWLGKEAENTTGHDRKLLAAQLYYVQEVDFQAIDLLLGRQVEDLGGALRDGAVLLELAYLELCWSNDALAGYVLNKESPLSPPILDLLAKYPAFMELGEWSPSEVAILLWRLRNGLLTEQILRFEACNLDAAALDILFARFCARYPFEAAARRLLSSFGLNGISRGLLEPSLWKRMVFQHHCSHQLPMKQILERLQPPATVIGYKLTPAMLTGWIGMGRLFSQLAKFMQEAAATGC